MRKFGLPLLAAFLLTLWIFGCGGDGKLDTGAQGPEIDTAAAPTFSYWPQAAGNSWRYRVSTYTSPNTPPATTSTQVLKISGRQTINGQQWFAIAQFVAGVAGTQWRYSRHTSTGLQWRDALADAAYYLLKTPLTVGTSWDAPASPGPGTITRRISSLGASVTVPAGTFADCAIVTETNSATPGAEARYWLARGVGLVRRVELNGGDVVRKQELLSSVVGAKEVARSLLLTEVIKPATVTTEMLALSLGGPLPAGTVIAPFAPHPLPAGVTALPSLSDETVLTKSQWFFWVDSAPHAKSCHATRYVFIDTSTLEVVVKTKWWPPAINGVFKWSNDADRWNPANWAYSRLNVINAPSPSPNAASLHPSSSLSASLGVKGDVDGIVLVNGWSPGQTLRGDLSSDLANARDWARLHGVPDATASNDPGGLDGIRKAIQALVNKGANDIILYITCHGGRDASGKSYLSIHGHKVTAADLSALLDDFPKVDFKIVLDACYSGGLSNTLAASDRVRIVINSSSSTETSNGDWDPNYEGTGKAADPNPEDVGSEFSSGLWHDMQLIMDTPAQLQAAHEWAAAQGLPPMAGVLHFAFNSACSLDVAAKHGLTHPGLKVHPAAPGG